MSAQTPNSSAGGEFAWTNPSVRALAGEGDPLDKIVTISRRIMAAAADTGLDGPPFDPFRLAEMLGLALRAHADVPDACVNVATNGAQDAPDAPLRNFLPAHVRLVVEYNPTRPRGRLRYNVAHEIAHALFPDVAEAARHRTGAGAVPQHRGDDSWQLELLCNIAAAEFLMPSDAVAGLADIDPDIDFIMAQRQRFDVSTEALLRRLASATSRPLAVLATSRIDDRAASPLRIEYVVGSRVFNLHVRRGDLLDPTSELGTCTAIGQTVRDRLTVAGRQLRIQAVGVPGYPGRTLPRVLAICEPVDAKTTSRPGLRYMTGDVTAPDTSAPVIIGHITNDAARAWGRRGVARSLARRFPDAARAYRNWAIARPDNLRLGRTHLVEVSGQPPIHVASMVAQRGYGPGSPPRLVYTALADALEAIGDAAVASGAEVHLPRIGTGQAGGRWDLVEAEIDDTLVSRGVPVVVYSLPPRISERAL